MSATFKIMCDYGGVDGTPATEQDTSALSPNLQFKTGDNNLAYDSGEANDRIPIPPSGSSAKRSYWKHIYLKCVTAPASFINNVKFYSDGAAVATGVVCKVCTSTPVRTKLTSTGYKVATGTPGSQGDAYSGTMADAATKTAGSPLSVGVTENPTDEDHPNSILNSDETTHYVILQLEVASTAAPGDTAEKTYTFAYDEA